VLYHFASLEYAPTDVMLGPSYGHGGCQTVLDTGFHTVLGKGCFTAFDSGVPPF
jgi:hypothetical protein